MNSNPRSLPVLVAALVAFGVLAGCGGDAALVEVTGTVTYQGQPVPDANVLFQPEGGPPATGQTDSQGHFSLNTGGRPGVPAGTSQVAVTAYEDVRTVEPGEADPEGYSEVRSLIPEKYANMVSSPLTAEVVRGETNHFDFELTD